MKNFHTHTYRCKHAEGSLTDYVKMAKLKNVTELGFSEHAPLPDGWWSEVRMGMEELPLYVQEVLDERDQNPEMRILLGLECDYTPEYESFYREINAQYPFDYLVGSIHAFPYEGETVGCFENQPYENKVIYAYTEYCVKAMESGLFTFMAHPDLFCLRMKEWNAEMIAASVYILQAAKDLKMPLEINCSGIRKSFEMGRTEIAYPRREFWELAGSFGIKGIVNSDAHAPKDLTENMDAGFFIMKEYGIDEFVL